MDSVKKPLSKVNCVVHKLIAAQRKGQMLMSRVVLFQKMRLIKSQKQFQQQNSNKFNYKENLHQISPSICLLQNKTEGAEETPLTFQGLLLDSQGTTFTWRNF